MVTSSSSRSPLPRGLQFIVAFLAINLALWLFGQTGSLVNYDFVASLGLQEPRDTVEAGVFEANRGLTWADTLIPFPLLALALLGFRRRQFYGFVCAWVAMGHAVYWPMLYWMLCVSYRHGNVKAPMPGVEVMVLTIVFFALAWFVSWYMCRWCSKADVSVAGFTNDSSSGTRRIPLSRGLRLIVAYLALNLVLWSVGQTGSLINNDFVASLGLTEPLDTVEVAVYETNRAIALADTFVIWPLLIFAIVGLLRRKFYGFVCSWMVFGWGLYWPTIFWMQSMTYQQGDSIKNPKPDVATVAITILFFGLSAWASGFLCQLCYEAENDIDKVFTPTASRRASLHSKAVRPADESDPLLASK